MNITEKAALILLFINILSIFWASSKVVFSVDAQRNIIAELKNRQIVQDETLEEYNTRISKIEGHLGL